MRDGRVAALGDYGAGAVAPALEIDQRADHLEWLVSTMPGFSYRCLLDANWTMLLITSGIQGVSGYPPEDFIENRLRSYASVIHPQDRARVVREINTAVQAGCPFSLDYRIVHQDGSVRWVRERGRAVEEGGAFRFIDGFVVDRAEFPDRKGLDGKRHSARESQQAALVALATSDAVASGNLTEVCELVTELVSDAIKVARTSVWMLNDSRTVLRLINLYSEDTRTHSSGTQLDVERYPAYFSALQGGRLIDASDAENDPRTREFATGYLRPLGISSMMDATLRMAGEVVGVLCIEHIGPGRMWRDDEAHFCAEVADQLSHALLNGARRQAQEQQEQLQEQLFRSQKLEAVGRLAGGVAHDFNNLLTIIGGFAEQVRDELPPGPLQEDLEEILAATERAAELTNQLLAFSRKESIELVQLDLVASLQHAQKMLARLLGSDINFTMHLPTAPLMVHANEGLLQQILTNLVVNARDAISGAGNIDVSVEPILQSSPLHTEGAELPAGRYAVLKVADSGAGMTKAVAENIFEPFFTTKGAGAGTGLGLSTVYGIVRRLDGGIAISSQLDVGSEFSIYLPALEAEAPRALSPPAPTTQQRPGKGRRVLVAEDNRAVLQLIKRNLSDAGFEVVTALGTAEALIALEGTIHAPSLRPELVLTDMTMPGGGGLRILHWLEQHHFGTHLGFISGYMSESQSRAIEGFPHLQKPFVARELLPFVLRALDSRKINT